ncbi:MAG TPA: hypothetical protein DD409_09555 [Bacteroidales bacterium]|nr:hypothetical protein [Bacteroidales bacterium]
MKTRLSLLMLVTLLVALVSCNGLPDTYTETTDSLMLVPDYQSVTLPVNVAPMNVLIDHEADDYSIHLHSKNGKSLIVKGKKASFPIKSWKRLLEANPGEDLLMDVYIKKGGQWIHFPTVTNHIAPEPVDPFVTYRFLPPLYTTYEAMSIDQRDLTSFDVTSLYDSRLMSSNTQFQCVNCHSFQDYNRTGNMQLHVRGDKGGTIIVQHGSHQKVNLKAEGLIGGAVYPSWHPTSNLIAYSINTIGQNFYTKKQDKVEVMDDKSDLILYDIDANKIIPVSMSPDWLETFPYWSPDGRYLYFAAASFKPAMMNTQAEIIIKHNTIRYNLVRMPFDPDTKTFGPADTLISARETGKSSTFPRVSPDGRYLLFTMGDYGNFHIWHKSSDLYLMNLATGVVEPANAINSPDVESYHSWSSNGRWVVFSSRRQDGGYTRLFLAYFDNKGRFHKPFVIPQKDPAYYQRSLKSFNIPEFTVQPAPTDRHHLVKAISEEASKAELAH